MREVDTGVLVHCNGKVKSVKILHLLDIVQLRVPVALLALSVNGGSRLAAAFFRAHICS